MPFHKATLLNHYKKIIDIYHVDNGHRELESIPKDIKKLKKWCIEHTGKNKLKVLAYKLHIFKLLQNIYNLWH